MMNAIRNVVATGVVGVITAPVFAHPGHGKDGGSHELSHYLTEPVHVSPLVIAGLIGAVAAVVVVWWKRRA